MIKVGINHNYSEQQLLELYLGKIKELGRIPRSREINQDPQLPAHSTFYRRLGSDKEILKKLGFNINPRNFNKLLCLDCPYDPRSCGRKYEDCRKEAELYFKMLKKNR